MDLNVVFLALLVVGVGAMAAREAIALHRDRQDQRQKMLDRAFRRAKRLDLSGSNDRR